MLGKTFWVYAGQRALRTVCQTALALLGTAVYLTDVSWVQIVSASVLSGIVSVLTSITMGLPEVSIGSGGSNGD